MRAMRRLADGLIGLSAAIGALGLAVIMVTILVDVIGSQFGRPLFGALDIVIMSFVIVVFGGMALCDRIGGHISVDVLESRYSPGLNRAIDAGSAILGAAIFLTLAWSSWESAKLSEMLNHSTNLLRLPHAWFRWALSAFSVLTALGLLLRAAEIALEGRDVRKEKDART